MGAPITVPARWGGRLLRARWPLLIWAPVAALAAADGFPSAAWHAPITAMAIGVTAVITYAAQHRARRSRLRYLSAMILHLRRRADAFERGATTDRLTRLLNRRTFYEALDRAMPGPASSQTVQRDRPGGALLMIDINDFKQINDRWGHHIGDRALQRFARILRQETSDTDTCGRLGGDEFAVLMAAGTEESAARLLERIKSAAANAPIDAARGVSVTLSLSIGAVLLNDHTSRDAALIAADRLLYADKARHHEAAGAA